jgi:hypothetical protein
MLELNWYGNDWGSQICKPEHRVETPYGQKCGGCGNLITSGSNGVVEPQATGDGVLMQPWHVGCYRKAGLAHSRDV